MSLFNRVDYTKKTLELIFNNSGYDFDLFLVDDNSTDDTKNYLLTLKEQGFCKSLNITLNEENFGKAKNLNKILKQVYSQNYDYFCILDNDIVFPDNWLLDSVSILNKNLEVGSCSVLTQPYLIKQNPNSFREETNYIDSDLVGGANLIWNHRVKNLIGLFCEEYGKYGHEDADFTFRIRLSGHKTVYLKTFGIHIGEDTHVQFPTSETKINDPYRQWKTEMFLKTKNLLFENVKKYVTKQKSLLLK